MLFVVRKGEATSCKIAHLMSQRRLLAINEFASGNGEFGPA